MQNYTQFGNWYKIVSHILWQGSIPFRRSDLFYPVLSTFVNQRDFNRLLLFQAVGQTFETKISLVNKSNDRMAIYSAIAVLATHDWLL